MRTIEVFDPAMCCSTGVCGPSVDQALVSFAADVDWLASQGVKVERFNLAQQPGAFAERDLVAEALRAKGEQCLPLVLADGELASEGTYPSRAELARLAGIEQPAAIYTPAVDELVAIAAAVASNCEPCLDYHVGIARELGVADEDIAKAVKTARKVKETPARSILRAADELLGTAAPKPSGTPLPVVASNGGSCCSSDEPEATTAAKSGSGSCC